jgi:hypothetical protein
MADDAVNQIERLLNSFGAELTVQKIILQLLLSQILMLRPDLIEETVEQMKAKTLTALQRIPKNPASSPDEETRVRTVATSYADDFFQSLSEAVSVMRNKLGQSGRN